MMKHTTHQKDNSYSDHTGERALKLAGSSNQIDVNADHMRTSAVLDRCTLYPSPYMVFSDHGYTKHYYAGTERIAARIGGGGLDHDRECIVEDGEAAGRVDKLFWKCLEQVNSTEIEHQNLQELDIVDIDGNPMEAAQRFDIDNMPSGLKCNAMPAVDWLHGMIQHFSQSHPPAEEPDVYFYHSDHLGSASWITDADGTPVQHLQYLPYGEPFVNQRVSDYSERFTFTGKERDAETGYGYFGARYMDHDLMTMWLSVDPMMDKYPSMSPYNYCAWNPVKLVDPDGRDTLNFAASKFLRKQPDISNALIINGHGKSRPPVIKNDNIDFDDDFSLESKHDVSIVASYISRTSVYQENGNNNNVTPLFLISCQTGESSAPYQSFADGLDQLLPNTLVVAPVGDVHARKNFMWLEPKDGEVYDCYWRILYNGQDVGRIENYEAFDIPSLLSSTQQKVNAYNATHQNNQIQLPKLELQ